MKSSLLILLIGMNLLWAGTYSVYKFLGASLQPESVVTLRFALAGVALLLLWPFLRGNAPRGTDLLRAIIMGIVVFSLGPWMQVWAVQHGQAGDAAVLMAFEPLLASMAAATFLREKIPTRRWLGFAFGALGILFLARIWSSDFQRPALLGNSLMLLSFACETTFSVMGKPLLRRSDPIKLVAVGVISATLFNLALAGPGTFADAQKLTMIGWSLLIYLALVCTVIGYVLWLVVVGEAGLNQVALTVFVQPIAGLGVAIFWLGESMHWGQLWGSLAILAGLIVGLSRSKPAREQRVAASVLPETRQVV